MARVQSFQVSAQNTNLTNPQSSQVLSSLWVEGLALAFFKNNINTNVEFTEVEFTAEWSRLAQLTGLDFSGIKFGNSFQANAKALLASMSTLDIKDKRSKALFINGQRAFGVSDRTIQAKGVIKKTYNEKHEDGTPNIYERTFDLGYSTVTQDGVTFEVSSLSGLEVGTRVNITVGCYVATATNNTQDLRFGTVFDRYIPQETAQAQPVPQPVPVPEPQPQPQQPEPQPEPEQQPVGDGGLDIGA